MELNGIGETQKRQKGSGSTPLQKHPPQTFFERIHFTPPTLLTSYDVTYLDRLRCCRRRRSY